LLATQIALTIGLSKSCTRAVAAAATALLLIQTASRLALAQSVQNTKEMIMKLTKKELEFLWLCFDDGFTTEIEQQSGFVTDAEYQKLLDMYDRINQFLQGLKQSTSKSQVSK
jgi:hypothetical protein